MGDVREELNRLAKEVASLHTGSDYARGHATSIAKQLRALSARAAVPEGKMPALPMAKEWAQANGLAVTQEWMDGWNAYRAISLVVATAPRAIWCEEWQGSGPQRGWHMRVLDGGNYGSVIAYLGDQISTEAVSALVSHHNAAIAAAPQPESECGECAFCGTLTATGAVIPDGRWVCSADCHTLLARSERTRANAAPQPAGEANEDRMPKALCDWLSERGLLPEADEDGGVDVDGLIEMLNTHEDELARTPHEPAPSAQPAGEEDDDSDHVHEYIDGECIIEGCTKSKQPDPAPSAPAAIKSNNSISSNGCVDRSATQEAATITPEREAMSRMKDAAIEAHRLCYEAMLANPEVVTLSDDGELHKAIHAIVGVETPSYVAPADVQALARLIANDGFACSFQSMSQYRGALLREAYRLSGALQTDGDSA